MQKMFFLASLFLISLLFQGCNKDPSDFFKGRDMNSDGFISYVEWMHFPGDHTHSIYFCYRKYFYEGDCDADDRLLWEEYYQRRFKERRCSPIMPPRPKAQSKFHGFSAKGKTGDKIEITDPYTKEYVVRLLAKEKQMMEKYKLTYESLLGPF